MLAIGYTFYSIDLGFEHSFNASVCVSSEGYTKVYTPPDGSAMLPSSDEACLTNSTCYITMPTSTNKFNIDRFKVTINSSNSLINMRCYNYTTYTFRIDYACSRHRDRAVLNHTCILAELLDEWVESEHFDFLSIQYRNGCDVDFCVTYEGTQKCK